MLHFGKSPKTIGQIWHCQIAFWQILQIVSEFCWILTKNCCILGIRHAVSSKVQGTVKVRQFKNVWNLNSTPILFCNSGFHGDAVNAFDGTLFGVRVTDCARQPDRCPGGPLNSCAPGRNASSPSCSKCKLGYSDAGKDCEPCGEGALSAFGLFGLVLAWVERFDRRGTEPFELFRSDFGQNSWNPKKTTSVRILSKFRNCR